MLPGVVTGATRNPYPACPSRSVTTPTEPARSPSSASQLVPNRQPGTALAAREGYAAPDGSRETLSTLTFPESSDARCSRTEW